MHHDSADYASVRAKVEKKFPGLVKNAQVAEFFDELVKIGAVSDEQAQRALARYETLDRNKPTTKQVGRYAGLGAVAAPVAGALSDAIAGKGFDKGKRLRGVAGRMVGGALTSGAVPIVRASLDRRAEKETLKQYIGERGVGHTSHPVGGKLSEPFEPVEKTARDHLAAAVQKLKEKDSGMSGATPARPFACGSEYDVSLTKGAFATSAYSSNIGYPTAPQKSYQPGFRMPQLAHAVQAQPQAIKVSFKLQGHTEHQGLGIAIENQKGSVRKGVGKDGKPWRTEMKHPYGYIKGSKGADGEEVDAYVGPAKDATHAHVVHQRKEDGKTYDEDKVMLGFASKKDAVKAYLAHYNDPKFLGPVKSVPIERLKELIASGKKLVKISAGAPTRGNFMMASEVPSFRAPTLKSPIQPSQGPIVEKLGGAPTTPAGFLASAKRVGAPRVTSPSGPSIAQVAKPVGFGKPQSGALKNSI